MCLWRGLWYLFSHQRFFGIFHFHDEIIMYLLFLYLSKIAECWSKRFIDLSTGPQTLDTNETKADNWYVKIWRRRVDRSLKVTVIQYNLLFQQSRTTCVICLKELYIPFQIVRRYVIVPYVIIRTITICIVASPSPSPTPGEGARLINYRGGWRVHTPSNAINVFIPLYPPLESVSSSSSSSTQISWRISSFIQRLKTNDDGF